MGGGGLDVEYMNARLKEGRAVLMGSAHLVADGAVPGLLEPLAFFGKLAAEFRGRKPLVAPSALAGTFLRFRDLAAAYSPFAGGSPFVIEEAEVNPFVVASGRARAPRRRLPILAGQAGRRRPSRRGHPARCSGRRRSASSASRRR